MDLPRIGGAKGVFDVFVPGLFLWLNLIGLLYLWPWSDETVKSAIEKSATTNLPPAITLSIVFGYLIGVLLRLLRCGRVDRISALWLRMFSRGARKNPEKRGVYKPFAVEPFPYFKWIEYLCEHCYPEALDFFRNNWKPAAPSASDVRINRQFFNFRKNLINSQGGARAVEIYAAEALTRYMAGMFHALFVAAIAVIMTCVFRLLKGQSVGGLLLIALAYLLATACILRNFRLIRLKEVEVVFAADFDLMRQRKLEIGNHGEYNNDQTSSVEPR